MAIPEPTSDDAPSESPTGVSMIVPAYEEEGSVGDVVARLSERLVEMGRPHEILVVDDGSRDQTADRAREAGARVIEHGRNRGYGAALKAGIVEARYPIVGITDADATYPDRRLGELVERFEKGRSSMVVGARTGEDVRIPLLRRPAKWAIGRLAEIIAGHAIPDLNSGMRVFLREEALRFFRLLPDGFSFTTTITLAMISNGRRVEYVPINYRERVGRSKIRPVRDTAGFVNLVLRIGLYFAPLKIFLPIAALLVGSAIAWGLISRFLLGTLADVSTLVLLVTGIQVAAIGMLAELINVRVPNEYRRERPGR